MALMSTVELNLNLTPNSRRRPNLAIPSLQHNRQKNAETEKKLRALKRELKINGISYETNVNDLEYLDELGNGTSGHVVKMRHKPSAAIIAVKQMRRTGNDEETKRITMDLDVVLKSHDCPYIVQCLGCFINEADVWICMELMSTCFDKLQKRTKKPIEEAILRHVTEATVKALYYLKERHGVIHRDVKPSNILIDERGHIKLCDFGISGRLVDSKAKTRSAGCAAYMAPERIDPKKPEYDIRADVWSLGITLVELATGAYPYKDCKTDFEVLTKVLDSDPPRLPENQGFSDEFRDFVKGCLTKDYRHRPKYHQLLEHPFLKYHESLRVDVPKWFHQITREAGIVLPTTELPTNSLLPTTTAASMLTRLTTTTTEFYQPTSSSTIPTTNNFIASQENPFSLAMKTNTLEHPSKNYNNPFMAQTNMTILSEQLKTEDRNTYANGATGNGYQKLPFRPLENEVVDDQLALKLNRLYTQSPQMPRKTYEMNNLHQSPQLNLHQSPQLNLHQSPQLNIHQSPQLNHHHLGSQSPYMQRKFGTNEGDFANHYSPYKPLPQQPNSTFSPVIRKRYQEGHLVSEDLEFRILHGNTSPIVLQRFYHQQNQFKDQKEEDQLRAIRMQSESPNTYRSAQSGIPVKSGSPLPNPRYQHLPQQPQMHRNILQHHHEPTYNASHKIYESNIPQLQSRMNGNGTIPYRHHLPQQLHHPQPMYDNVAHRAQLACPSSPQLDRLRANLEKPNFYERHQKLPVEIDSYQLEAIKAQQQQSNGAFIDNRNKDKGMVKTYIKSRFNGDQQSSKENEKMKSLATVSPMRSTITTNPFAQSPPHNLSLIKSATPSHVIQNNYERHRSPDPPPRNTRGNQSPLILRRKLELASGSPLLQRRLMSASPPPPLIPPRGLRTYNSDSVPGSPQHLHARINYTPEPQRRVYRQLDQ